MFNLKKANKTGSVFRNRPRSLGADEVNKVAGGDGGHNTSKKAPYDMDYATRHF